MMALRSLHEPRPNWKLALILAARNRPKIELAICRNLQQTATDLFGGGFRFWIQNLQGFMRFVFCLLMSFVSKCELESGVGVSV
jgi:hypothetical protein